MRGETDSTGGFADAGGAIAAFCAAGTEKVKSSNGSASEGSCLDGGGAMLAVDEDSPGLPWVIFGVVREEVESFNFGSAGVLSVFRFGERGEASKSVVGTDG